SWPSRSASRNQVSAWLASCGSTAGATRAPAPTGGGTVAGEAAEAVAGSRSRAIEGTGEKGLLPPRPAHSSTAPAVPTVSPAAIAIVVRSGRRAIAGAATVSIGQPPRLAVFADE